MTKSKAPASRKQKTTPKTAVRKNVHITYKEAVHDIRNMFLEQAALWKDQADRLEEASGKSETSLFQQEPWSFHVDADRRRPAQVFGEGKVQKEDSETKIVKETKEKLERSRKWRYKRPVQGEEESDDSEEDSDEDLEDAT